MATCMTVNVSAIHHPYAAWLQRPRGCGESGVKKWPTATSVSKAYAASALRPKSVIPMDRIRGSGSLKGWETLQGGGSTSHHRFPAAKIVVPVARTKAGRWVR